MNIHCIDGDVYISKELLEKSEKLRGPNGNAPGITKKKMISIIEAANPDELLRIPLPEDIKPEVLYSFFPYLRPEEVIDPQALTRELMRKMKKVRSLIKSFNVGCVKSCFISKASLERRAVVREKFLEEMSKIPGGAGIEKMFRNFNKINQSTLLRFEETQHVITKLYEDFLEKDISKVSKPTLKQI